MFQCPLLPEFRFRAMDFQYLELIFRDKTFGLTNQNNFKDEDLEAWKYNFSQPGNF